MTEKKSIVTPERFASGFTYKDYIGRVKVNKDRFEEYYATGQLSAEDKAFFRKATKAPNGVAKMLVLGEDWCPDAFRGIPLMARIAEASGVEMRIFPRDQNLDIMNEFLNHGEFMSLPVAVFYTKDLRYICHWIERPEVASRERAKIQEDVKNEKHGASEQEIRTLVGERTRTRFPAWQQESIREMREMLVKKLGI
jgi:hypothetical protein